MGENHKIPPGSHNHDRQYLDLWPVLFLIASSMTEPHFSSLSQNAALWLFFTQICPSIWSQKLERTGNSWFLLIDNTAYNN